MNDLQSRVRQIASAPRRPEPTSQLVTLSIAREWWLVTKPGEPERPVFFCPAQPWDVVEAWFPRAKVVPHL